MIPPNLLSVEWSYAAIPVWRWEPVALPPPPPPPPCGETEVEAATPGPSGPDDEPPKLQLVFKGYEWRPVALWDCIANPDWDRWVEGRQDESANRARDDDRRRALPVLPVMPLMLKPTNAAAGPLGPSPAPPPASGAEG